MRNPDLVLRVEDWKRSKSEEDGPGIAKRDHMRACLQVCRCACVCHCVRVCPLHLLTYLAFKFYQVLFIIYCVCVIFDMH